MTSTTPLSIPPELKRITQYIRRAEELDRDRTFPESRLVAYYLRQYAAQIGITSITDGGGGGLAPVKKCLGDILNNLEGEKKTMSNFSKKEAQFLCRGFADRVLDKANEQELAVMESIRSNNMANETTPLDSTMQQVFKDIAHAFYAAGTFYDILQQFYTHDDPNMNNNAEMDEERKEENKRRLYCKFKATNILKALKEGRIPTQQDETETETNPGMQPSQRLILSNSKPDVYIPPTFSEPPPPPTNILNFPSISHTSQAFSLPSGDSSKITTTTNTTPVWTSVDTDTPLIPVPILVSDLSMHSNEDNIPIVPPSNRLIESRRPTSGSNSNNAEYGGNVFSKGRKPVSNTQWSDARELTQFAMAALEAKDADLAAERLQGALEALGRWR